MSGSAAVLDKIFNDLSDGKTDAICAAPVVTVLGEVVDLIAEQYLHREHGTQVCNFRGWKVVQQINEFYGRADSLNMALYEKNGEILAIILGVRDDVAELFTEARHVLLGGGMPKSHRRAYEVLGKWKTDHPNLVVSGHSKGGTIASVYAAEHNLKAISIEPVFPASVGPAKYLGRMWGQSYRVPNNIYGQNIITMFGSMFFEPQVKEIVGGGYSYMLPLRDVARTSMAAHDIRAIQDWFVIIRQDMSVEPAGDIGAASIRLPAARWVRLLNGENILPPRKTSQRPRIPLP